MTERSIASGVHPEKRIAGADLFLKPGRHSLILVQFSPDFPTEPDKTQFTGMHLESSALAQLLAVGERRRVRRTEGLEREDRLSGGGKGHDHDCARAQPLQLWFQIPAQLGWS